MGQALGDILPLAVAVAIFPVPIIAVVLMLGSDRWVANASSRWDDYQADGVPLPVSEGATARSSCTARFLAPLRT
jgi:hypothetical protein